MSAFPRNKTRRDWPGPRVSHLGDLTTTGAIANYLLGQKVSNFDDNLWHDIVGWSQRRNQQAHAMGEISGESLTPWRTRLAKAKEVAEPGFALVNRVSKEARHHRL